MQVETSCNLLKALAIALLMALPVAALAADPTITLKVNGSDVSFQGAPAFDPDFGIWSSSLTAVGADWSLRGDVFFGEFAGEKAFIDYSLRAVGGNDITSFTLNLTFPFVQGPYTELNSSHSSVIADGGTAQLATVAAGVSQFSFIHSALLDNATVLGAQISQGCSGTGVVGFQLTCQAPLPPFNVPVSTASDGHLGAALSFTVSPHDTFSLAGNVELVGAVVPEPSAYLSLLAGTLAVLSVFARRRIR